MSFSEPLPLGFQPVACMTCGVLLVDSPVFRDFHEDSHARALLVPVTSPPALPPDPEERCA